MSKTADWIVNEFAVLKSHHSQVHQEAAEIAKCYTGGIIVPMPELNDVERPAVANIMKIGIDQLSMRIASVDPMTRAPSVRPGYLTHDNRADQRRQAIDGWNKMNNAKQKRRRRARFLVAYGTSPISISPVPESGDPRKIPWQRVRNPLCTFTAPTHDPDNIEPDYAIFLDHRSRSWLEDHFPAAMGKLRRGTQQSFDVLEYVDAYETTLVVVGSPREESTSDHWGYGKPSIIDGGAPHTILGSVPNRTNICPVVSPGRITLAGMQGQFGGMLGMYEQSAKLNALLMIQTVRDVFPSEWVESIPNSPSKPNIVEYADGLSATIGIVHNGRITRLQAPQNQTAQLALDSLERAQRLSGQVPAEWGGESGSNIRTARRGADVLSSATDMPIQEYQEILERSHEAEYRRMIAVMKTYYGTQPSMFFIPSDGKITREEYVPNDIFDTDQVYAKYPLPGADMSQLTVQIGQMVGDGTLSAQTGMELDPRVEDVPREIVRVQIEGLRRSLLASLEAGAQNGTTDPHKLSLIIQKLRAQNSTLEDSVDAVNTELQKQQAAQQQPPADADAAQEQQEQQQPGIAAPPGGVPPQQTSGDAGEAPVPPPNMGSSDLMKLLQTIHPPAPAAQAA